MTSTVRIDPHAHLYDSYSAKEWCHAALNNLGGGNEVAAVVIVVDREGQDSLARLRREVPSFGQWTDIWDGTAGQLTLGGGTLTIIQGVQYVTSESIEVLALGVERNAPDRLPALEYTSLINDQGGLACIPWSPGKWLGARGAVVRRLIDTTPTNRLVVGDIAIRSRMGPPSFLLGYAKRRGLSVWSGTDPLPRSQDQSLVGSFGLELRSNVEVNLLLASWSVLKETLLLPNGFGVWGRRNSVGQALQRFLSSR